MFTDRCKNHGCRQKIPEGTSSGMFDVRTIVKCCEFKRFSWENVFGPLQNPLLWTEKNQKALAPLGLASGPLLNAVNSSVVPTEFATELTTEDEVLAVTFVT